jgi:hypothetical protein
MPIVPPRSPHRRHRLLSSSSSLQTRLDCDYNQGLANRYSSGSDPVSPHTALLVGAWQTPHCKQTLTAEPHTKGGQLGTIAYPERLLTGIEDSHCAL